MDPYFFEFDLEIGEISADSVPHYAVRYYNTESGGHMVLIGDGYRHMLHLNAEHWNRILKIIKNNELDESGIKSITQGLLGHCLPEEYEKNLISGIKTGKLKEIELSISH